MPNNPLFRELYNTLAYQTNFTVAATKIERLRFCFQGTGSIASVKLASLDGKVVYENNFKQ